MARSHEYEPAGERAPEPDWTSGPAKWAAVAILGAASIYGIGWSILRQRPPAWPSPAVVAPPPAQAGRVAESQHGAVESTGPLAAAAPGIHPVQEPAAALPPVSEPAAEQPGPAPAAPSLTKIINLNTATEAELELLPGIGPALAKRIADDRAEHGPFKSIEDLARVRGIGPETIRKIRPLATVE